MTGNIIGEPFDKYVETQIKLRQSAQGQGLNSNRSSNILNYLNNRNAWVKMASSVYIDSTIPGSKKLSNLGLSPKDFNGDNLAKKAILFNTLSGIK